MDIVDFPNIIHHIHYAAVMLRNGLTTIPSLRPICVRSKCWWSGARPRVYSTCPSVQNDIAVIGGGVTGLACAYYITRQLPKANVTIYEASDRLGGWLSSKRVPVKDGSILLEAGPRTLRPADNGMLACALVRPDYYASSLFLSY